jgi:hypothetical protein
MRLFYTLAFASLLSACGGGSDSSSSTSDTIAPVITLAGDAQITVQYDDSYVDAGARALDNVDGDISVIVDGEVDTSLVGSYKLTFTATDSSGNSSSATRMVNVVDTIPPVISLTGDTEVTVELGEVYVDAGATAIDNADGDISVIVDGEVNTSTIGSYQLTYTATDSSGNSSSVTRAVTIIEKLTTIAGKVIDGYVSGATVWLDYNGNGKFDEQTEPSTMSGEAGDYSFEFTEEQKQCLPYSTMYVDVPVGALDEDTGIVTEAYQMALPPSINILSDDELRHISPLTSSIWGLLRSQLKDSGKGNLSCADLMDDIALRNEIRAVVGSVILNAVSHYNLSEEQMFADFILDDNSDAYDAAQEVVKGLKAAYKYTLNLNEQYPSAVEIRVVVYQSTENDERYNLDTAWYRDVVIFLDNKTISEDVKLKDTGALDQVDYVLTRLERVDSPWGDQKYNGVLSIRNDVYVNEDLTYRCGVIEKIILEKNDITYEIDNSMPTQDSPTFESCSANAIETPFERSFRVSYLVDDINYFGVFFFRDDKSEFNSLSAWLNIIDKADDLDPTDVFTYMNALPYEFDSAVQVDASYWRKRKTAGNVQIDTNNDNEWVRTTQREDYTTYTECSVDGINWDSCS